MAYQYMIPLKSLARRLGRFSEREFARRAGLSRVGLRGVLGRHSNVTLRSIVKSAEQVGREVHVLAISSETNTDFSTYAVGARVIHQTIDSWKIHFMDFVDEFRRSLDPQLLLLAPPRELPRELVALLASIVVQLCDENEMNAPSWARKPYFLDQPWFVSGVQSLKAIAIQESPLAFRRNNIYVHENFLERC